MIAYILIAIVFLGIILEIRNLRKRIGNLEEDEREYYKDLPYYKSDKDAGEHGVILGQRYRLDYDNDYNKDPHIIKIRLL